MQPVREMLLLSLLLVTAVPLVPGSQSSLVILNVLLHHPIKLACRLNKTLPITSVGWKYEKNGKQGKLLLDSSSNPYRTYPSQFIDRLEVSDKLLTLKIRDIRMEDTGIFYANIADTDGVVDSCVFNVTVYEPVPHPSIKVTKKIQSSDWCNVTLHCSVPTNSSSLSFSWKYGDNQTHPHTEDTIHLSLRDHSWDSDILCSVHNPVDNQNDSLLKICSNFSRGNRSNISKKRFHIITIIIIIIMILAIVILLLIFVTLRKRKQRQGRRPDTNAAPPPQDDKREPQYIQVTTSRPNGDQVIIRNNSLYDASPRPQRKTEPLTIYAEVKHTQGTRG